MNKRRANQLKLHRLWDEPVMAGAWHFGTSIDDDSDPGAGGGGDGGEGGTAGDNKGAKGGEGNKSGESDGKTKPTDEEAKLLKELMGQKKAAKEAAEEAERLKAQLKNFEGIDPEKVRKLLAEAEAEERRKLEAKGEYDRLVAQMGERHQEELTRVKGEAEEARKSVGSLQAQIAELTVGTSFANSHFVREDLTLTPAKARVIYGTHFEFKDGKVVGYDKPAGASDRTPLVNAQGQLLSFDEALAAIVAADPDKDQLLRSKMKPGAASGGDGSKPPKVDDRPMSSVERIAKGLKALADPK